MFAVIGRVHEGVDDLEKDVLREGPLRVVDVVGEARLQGVVDLAILIQLVNNQLVHYVDVEGRCDLEA